MIAGLEAGNAFTNLNHHARTFVPDAHGHPVPRTGPRLSDTPLRQPGPEPVPGADTTAYLLAHGFSDSEVEALITSGAVVQG